jgi:long-chain acyl-CoA synthetase
MSAAVIALLVLSAGSVAADTNPGPGTFTQNGKSADVYSGGLAEEILGQAIKAIVVLDAIPLTETDIMTHCRACLEDYMVPKLIELRRELPKSPSGKVSKSSILLSA